MFSATIMVLFED
jgi:hypothetical protein